MKRFVFAFFALFALALPQVAPADEAFDNATVYTFLTTGTSKSGKQRVDTGYRPNGRTIVRAKYSPNSASDTQCLLCARPSTTRSSADPSYVFFLSVSGTQRFDYYDKAVSGGASISAGTTYLLEIKDGTATVSTDDGVFDSSAYPSGAIDFDVSHNLYLFTSCSHSSDTDEYSGFDNGAQIKFYYLRIYEVEDGKEVLKREYVPCVDADGTVAVAETVTQTVLYNPAGTFSVAGAEVAYPTLAMKGNPGAFGDMDYSSTSVEPGQAVSKSAFEGTWTNEAGDLVATCTGYTLFTNDVSGAAIEMASGSTTTCSFTMPDCDVTLQWNFDIEIKSDYDFERQFTLTLSDAAKTAIGDATLTDFPVPVRLSASAISDFYYKDFQCAGEDVEFHDEEGNVLPFELDTWDTTGTSLYWVKVPSLTKDTKIFVQFGGATPVEHTASDVWTKYVAVVHGGETLADASPAALAVTANGVAGVSTNGFLGASMNKAVCKTVGLNITNPYDKLTDSGVFTVSGWYRLAGSGTQIIGASRSGWNSGSGFLWLQEGSSYISLASSGKHLWSSGSKFTVGTWGHAAFSYRKGTSAVGYFNGAKYASKTSPGTLDVASSSSSYWTFGSYMNTSSDDSMMGDMDELRVYDGEASATWLACEYGFAANADWICASAVSMTVAAKPNVGVEGATPDATSVALSLSVRSLGEGASSVQFKAEVKVSGAASGETVDVGDALTETGTYSFSITGLEPETDYEISVWAENDLGKNSSVSSFAVYTAPAIALLETPMYRAGLKQAKFNIGNSGSAWTTYTADDSVIDVEVTPGVGMASVVASETTYSTVGYTNPYTGTTVYWNKQNSTFAYFGEMYFEAGKTYVFGKLLDDAAYIVVDGTQLMKDTGWNTFVTAKYTPTESGWKSVDIRVADGTGGKGPSGSIGGAQLGLAYNDNGDTSQSATTWKKLIDPGDGSLFSLQTCPGSSVMGMGSLSVDGSDAVVWLRFEGVPSASTLYVLYASTDYGETLTGWNQLKLADIAAGDTRATRYRASGVTSSAAVRFVIVTASGETQYTGLQSFTQIGPGMSLSTTDVGYTDASLSVSVDSFGIGATSASLTVELATDEAFTSVVETRDLGTVTSIGSTAFAFDDLTTNTTYYVRVSGVNNGGESSTTSVSAFTTLLPTAATSGTPVVTDIGHTDVSVRTSVTDYGLDSSSATVTIQVSETSDFASVVSESDPVELSGDADLGALKTLVAEDLAGNTAYYVRARVVNTWGFVSYGATLSFSTKKSVVLTGIGYTYDEGGALTATVTLCELYTSPATISLMRDGVLVGTAEVTSAGSYDFALAGGTANLTATVTTSEDSASAAMTAVPGTSCVASDDLSTFATARTAIVLEVGDRVLLPPLVGTAVYTSIADDRFASLDGTTLTAKEPGFAAVEHYDSAGALVATGFVVILPADMPADGRVFLYDDTVKGAWSSAATWIQVGVDSNADFPNGTGDVAYIPSCGTSDFTVTVDGVYSLQDLYIGRVLRTTRTIRLCGKKGVDSSLAFYGAGTGKRARPGVFMVESLTADGAIFYVNLGGSDADTFLTVTAENDLDMDFGGPRGTLHTTTTTAHYNALEMSGLALTVPEGNTIAMVNGPVRKHGVDQQWQESSKGYTLGASFLRGKGTFRIEMPGIFTNWDSALDKFEGTFVNAVRDQITQAYSNRGGSLWSLSLNATNATMRIEGFVTPNSFTPSSSVGVFMEGNTHGYGDGETMKGNNISKYVEMAGGMLFLQGFNKGKTGFVLRDDGDYEAQHDTDSILIDAGLSFIQNPYATTSTGVPISHLNAADFQETNDGSVYIHDARTYNNSTTIRAITELHGFANNYVGYTGDEDATNDVFPIVPWCVTKVEGNNSVLWWSHVDEDSVMCRGGSRTSIALASVTDPNRNVWSQYQSTAISQDTTVNSLAIQNNGKEMKLGEGRTLTITSGGLILAYNNASIGTAAGGTANGSLVFPNKAYVYATSTDANAPNQIWAPITSEQGLVVAFDGKFVLGGDQTGIDDHITVNAGTLYLGSTDGKTGCTIDVPLTLVGGQSKLVLAKSGADTLKDIDLNLVSAGGYGPKLQMPAGATESCHKLYLDGGKALHRGTYGATGSGADNIDDEHFTGTGVLNVRSDDAQGTIVLLK